MSDTANQFTEADADEMLRSNDWAKHSDARWLLMQVASRVAAVSAADNAALRARVKVLEDALQGVMSGCKYSCIAGEWHWHEKSIASNAALDAARATLEKTQ